MIIEERLARIDSIMLRSGAHTSFRKGACAMELVSWLAGEKWSDRPKCASPILTTFLQSWNDALDDAGRQKLQPYLARVIGTAGDGKDELRGWLAADWLVRVCTPAWLELAGIMESAAALRALPPLRSPATLEASRASLEEARTRGAAAWAAARAAAWAAARAAAWDAARAAARAAARDAATKKLEPTKVALQASALELLDRMIDPEVGA
ncbi:MAG TPA: hypothetical protein VNG73_07620 [Gemmatimonadaceae bacterium]|nr:hypothetical protein [Gemmatimonadaceae bacterium]